MQKGLFFLISFLFISIGHGQVQYLDLKMIQKNHVRKVIQVKKGETTPSNTDSSYVVFNENGQVIISNRYNYKYDLSLEFYEEEEIIYRYYDENGKMAGQVNFIPTSENPIKSVFLHSDDTLSKVTTHVAFHSLFESECKLDLYTKPIDTSQFMQDTVWITKNHAKVGYRQWGETTYYEDIRFDSKGRAETSERIELAFKPGVYEHIIKTSYQYHKNGVLLSKTENRFDEKGKHYETDEFYYSENGLLSKALLKSKRDNTVEEFEFIYEYRK